MDVFVPKVLIGMDNGVSLMDAQVDKFGMEFNVSVNLVIISMEPYVFYVLTVKNGIQEI